MLTPQSGLRITLREAIAAVIATIGLTVGYFKSQVDSEAKARIIAKEEVEKGTGLIAFRLGQLDLTIGEMNRKLDDLRERVPRKPRREEE